MRFKILLKKDHILLEMPHFNIGKDLYDLKAEKSQNPLNELLYIFKKYNKKVIETLLETNKFLTLFIKKEYKKLSNEEKNKLLENIKSLGVTYIIHYLQ